jgi:hypothetical protein
MGIAVSVDFAQKTLVGLFVSAWMAAAVGVCAAASSPDAATIETPFFRFIIQATNGNCEIFDKAAQVTWRGDEEDPGLGWITLKSEKTCRLTACQLQSSGNEITATFHPSSTKPSAKIVVRARALPDAKALELSYEKDPEIEIGSISLLDGLFTATAAGKGYALLPAREGLLVPASSGLDFTNRFDTSAYEGCHMQMIGMVEKGAAALLTWDDPYVAADLKSKVTKNLTISKPQQLSTSLVMRQSARLFQIHLLGQGDYVAIGKAYRAIAREKGLLVTWDQKLKDHPERAKLFGAANIKLWSALDRRMNEESTKEEAVHVNWTFDEAAQVAEHLKRDLKLDKVLFTIGGWIHRGYDNQHPDILPTAPECGGDAALSDCARRVLDLGYLFCLHDNYQDIYRDAPSWNERFVMKTRDGKLARGGHWAGGLAFLTCSQMALELAKRPQNLPAVKKLSNANSYFIDTTYAAGLQECFDPVHPLTRGDDMKWKQGLSDYARGVFAIFGSECGREWAIPHSDFFEGLTGVSGREFHDAKLAQSLDASVVPLFELVYHDCIAMYGKYGYDPNHAAEYVLHHIILGRPLNYHSIPAHLYWQQPDGGGKDQGDSPLAPLQADPALFTRANNGWAVGRHKTDRFIKNTCEVLSPLNELTAQMQMTQHEFLTPDRKVERSVFSGGNSEVQAIVNCSQTNFVCASLNGGQVTLPPYGFLVEAPTFVAFHALNWADLRYDRPVLFTLRSLDNQPLSVSHQIRVFHAFGDEHVRLGHSTRTIQREETFDPTEAAKGKP